MAMRHFIEIQDITNERNFHPLPSFLVNLLTVINKSGKLFSSLVVVNGKQY